MKKHIAVLPGDGIGPEVITEAMKILEKIAQKYIHEFSFEEGLIGASAIDKIGEPLPSKTLELCLKSDAILFGAIGDPKYDNDPSLKIRPEQGLLKLRKELNLYANIRPVINFEGLCLESPLRDSIRKGVDMVIVRELTGGIYFGQPRGRTEDGNTAFDTCVYSRNEIERITKVAFDLARTRQKKVTMVDKANVMATSRLWREVVEDMAKQNSDLQVEYLFVDNAAMQLIKNPVSFDVILTENMFGDILSDEASVITGSLGMLPSASLGTKTSLYEPIHGSYPQAAGKNIANPVATILSAAMLLEYSFQLHDEANDLRQAVFKALQNGKGTIDINSKNPLSTQEMGDLIAEYIV